MLVAISNFHSFRPGLTRSGLGRVARLSGIRVSATAISLSTFGSVRHGRYRLHSVSLSQLLTGQTGLRRFTRTLRRRTGPNSLIIVPTVFNGNGNLNFLGRVRSLARLALYRMPAVPPSLLNVQLRRAVGRTFVRRNNALLGNSRIVRNRFSCIGGRSPRRSRCQLGQLFAGGRNSFPLRTGRFMLTANDFFDRNLGTDTSSVRRPVFNLSVSRATSHAS